MNLTAFNRTVLILGLIVLAGYLAHEKIDPQAIAGIVAAVSGPLAAYVAVKGSGGSSRAKNSHRNLKEGEAE
jgi:ascorbate-specific PTS system EIIC-type component UlaA